MRLKKVRYGNCYVASEALYHLLGGKRSGWKPMVVGMRWCNHWFLVNTKTGQRLDATAEQFRGKTKPNYSRARGCGFLTKRPSRRARRLMKRIVWHENSIIGAH